MLDWKTFPEKTLQYFRNKRHKCRKLSLVYFQDIYESQFAVFTAKSIKQQNKNET